ncbi:HAD family hydrolase [Haliea sp. E17]|uniref:HAD family hydrolase n=1 Tax=Haliea sp. E17 TaxID=3401576 RepID=UPI003AAD039B
MVIFDWDGTLCDSVAQIVASVRSAALEIGLEPPSEAAAANIIGLGLPQAIEVLFPSQPLELRQEIARVYSGHYVANDTGRPRLFPGALQTLNALRGRGLGLAVATGKSRRGLDRVLGALDMGSFFDTSRCADETRSKPDPLMLLEIIEERQLDPAEVIMVGDTEYDLEMAANAGIASVGVSFGAHERERLLAHNPLVVVDSLPELLDLAILSR